MLTFSLGSSTRLSSSCSVPSSVSSMLTALLLPDHLRRRSETSAHEARATPRKVVSPTQEGSLTPSLGRRGAVWGLRSRQGY